MGRMAHIHAHSPGGPRWAAPYTRQYLNSYNNLILLCQRHHDLIDGDENSYPAALLREWKRTQEDRAFARRSSVTRLQGKFSGPQLALPFTERRSLSLRLRRMLDTTQMVALVGLSGSGKSQLAAEYFERAPRGSLRLWIDASSRQTVENQLSDVALALDPDISNSHTENALARWAVEHISETTGALCVFDGAPSYEAVEEFIPRGANVLVTSQSQGWPDFHLIQVGSMSPEEALSLLEGITKLKDSALRETAELSGLLPIVLKHAGKYIARQAMTPGRLNRLLSEDYDAVLKRGAGDADRPLTTVINAICDELSPASLLLAEAIALLHDTPLPLEPVEGFEGLLSEYATEVGLEDALAELLNFSLILRDEDAVRMHALVSSRLLARPQYDPTLPRLIAYAFLVAQLPPHTHSLEDRRRYHLLIPHAAELLAREGDALDAEMRDHLTNRVAAYYTHTGRHAQAERMLRGALRDDDEQSALRGSLTHNLANAAFEAGRLVEAEQLARDALVIKRRELDGRPENEHVAYTYALLGDVEYAMGKHEAGIANNRKAADIFEAYGYPRQASGALMTVAAALLELRIGSPGDVASVLDRVEVLLGTEEGRGSYEHNVRLAMIQASFQAEVGDFTQAAREAHRARCLAKTAGARLDEARAITLQAKSLLNLNPAYDCASLLRRALEALDSAGDVGVVAKECARGNIAVAFAMQGDRKEGVQLATQSLEALEGELPAGHATVTVARQLLNDIAAS